MILVNDEEESSAERQLGVGRVLMDEFTLLALETSQWRHIRLV